MTSDELPRAVWDALLARGERRVFEQGEVLFAEGDPPGPVIAVLDGELRVEASSSRGVVDIDLCRAGTIVGEVAAIDGLPRSATVVATTRSEIVAIGGVEFNNTLVEHPELALWVLRLFAARLRNTTASKVARSESDVDSRLARVLATRARTDAVPIGTLMMLRLRPGELSELVAADPEDTSRALARLHAHGWVLPGTDCLHVVNVAALEALAG